MPPLHPALVHFPIALVIFSVVIDLIGMALSNSSLSAAGRWSLTGAAVMMIGAIASGYYDMNRASLSAEVDGYVHLHLRIGWIIFAVIIVLLIWRWLLAGQLSGWQGATYSICGLLVAALVAFQAWYGGEMVYVHGASVAPAAQGVEKHDKAKRRLHKVYELLGAPAGEGHK